MRRLDFVNVIRNIKNYGTSYSILEGRPSIIHSWRSTCGKVDEERGFGEILPYCMGDDKKWQKLIKNSNSTSGMMVQLFEDGHTHLRSFSKQHHRVNLLMNSKAEWVSKSRKTIRISTNNGTLATTGGWRFDHRIHKWRKIRSAHLPHSFPLSHLLLNFGNEMIVQIALSSYGSRICGPRYAT